MNKPTDQKDTAARNRKGCIVELCIILVLLILALIPLVKVISNMLRNVSVDYFSVPSSSEVVQPAQGTDMNVTKGPEHEKAD